MTPTNILPIEDNEGRILLSKVIQSVGNLSKELLGIKASWEAFCFSYVLNFAIK